MTLKKAIEIVTFEDHATLQPRNDDFWDAIRLLREAGKKVIKQRQRSDYGGIPKLPGETED